MIMEKRNENYANCNPKTREYFEKLDAEYNTVVDYYNLISTRELLLSDKEILTAVKRYAKAKFSDEFREMISAYMNDFKKDLCIKICTHQEPIESQVSPEIIRMIDLGWEE